jgi:hypothetical protein
MVEKNRSRRSPRWNSTVKTGDASLASLAHLVAYFLPVSNEVAGIFSTHYGGALVFQDRQYGFCDGALGVALFNHNGQE